MLISFTITAMALKSTEKKVSDIYQKWTGYFWPEEK
jgi:hypothetical protein